MDFSSVDRFLTGQRQMRFLIVSGAAFAFAVEPDSQSQEPFAGGMHARGPRVMPTVRFTRPIVLRNPPGGILNTPEDVIAWLDATSTEFCAKRTFHPLRRQLREAVDGHDQKSADDLRERLLQVLEDLKLAR
jgi:hypothetical protein